LKLKIDNFNDYEKKKRVERLRGVCIFDGL
jgi:hypothetical protein